LYQHHTEEQPVPEVPFGLSLRFGSFVDNFG